MDTTKSLLDMLKIKQNLRSDYALAKFLGVTQPSVTRWRDGGGLSDDNAIRVADLLDLPRPYVLACMAAERSTSDSAASGTWRQIADAFKDKVAVLTMLAALGITGFCGNDAHAAGGFELRNNVYYGKSRKQRDRRRKIWPCIKAAA